MKKLKLLAVAGMVAGITTLFTACGGTDLVELKNEITKNQKLWDKGIDRAMKYNSYKRAGYNFYSLESLKSLAKDKYEKVKQKRDELNKNLDTTKEFYEYVVAYYSDKEISDYKTLLINCNEERPSALQCDVKFIPLDFFE